MYLQLPPRHKVANLIKQIIDLYHLPPGMVHLKSLVLMTLSGRIQLITQANWILWQKSSKTMNKFDWIPVAMIVEFVKAYY